MSDDSKAVSVKLHGGRIEEYALIGDCETAALVSLQGSIDWLCWPTFSSGACFAALLGTEDHGFWKIAPEQSVLSIRRRYLTDTMIVETIFATESGTVKLIDFMPPRGKNSDVIRIVRGVSGQVKMHMDLRIRFDYGRTIPWVTHLEDGFRAVSGPHMTVLRTSVSLQNEDMKSISQFNVSEGDEAWFVLTYASSVGADGDSSEPDPVPVDPRRGLEDTKEFWTEWNSHNSYAGKYSDAVRRSLMTLKALTYRPSGGIVAAVTTSLPEAIGGSRNWDYRFCWLRDTAFTLMVLLHVGYKEEATAWRLWLLRAIAGAPSQVQTLYGICGERQLVEWEVDWLPGYENSRPVRIGNAASEQFQLDLFGEVATALGRMPPASDDIKVSSTSVQGQLINHLCEVWNQPDDGIWEMRGVRKHFTYSKVMAWVALDRAIKHHELYDGGGDVKCWRENRDTIHKEVCEKGFSTKLNSFTQSYGSDELDASCLRLGLVGFLPMDDPRIVGTVDAIQKDLTKDGFVARYNTAKSTDGLPPGEGSFLACSFWMVSCLWLIGRHEEAIKMFERLLSLRNDVGLLAEEWDVEAGRMAGNFPQALSHIALCQAAFTISGSWNPEAEGEANC
jgi:GH15 family glucan-1,4-alpha-glucosidase